MKLPIKYSESAWHTRKEAREQYIEEQHGLCYFCLGSIKEEPSKLITNIAINKKLFPTNFFNHPIHLHHSHKTGLTLGAVHCKCNAILWQYHGE